jgi:hypothetical protein
VGRRAAAGAIGGPGYGGAATGGPRWCHGAGRSRGGSEVAVEGEGRFEILGEKVRSTSCARARPAEADGGPVRRLGVVERARVAEGGGAGFGRRVNGWRG